MHLAAVNETDAPRALTIVSPRHAAAVVVDYDLVADEDVTAAFVAFSDIALFDEDADNDVALVVGAHEARLCLPPDRVGDLADLRIGLRSRTGGNSQTPHPSPPSLTVERVFIDDDASCP